MKRSECKSCGRCGIISAWATVHESGGCGKCIGEMK